MVRSPLTLAALCIALLGANVGHAAGPDAAHPDWPCVQRKVPSLTPAAIWAGPALEDAGNWRDDDAVAALVDRLPQRRLPLQAAQDEIEAFAADAGPDKQERLTALFAGLFQVMNAERSAIIGGVERYARRQKAMASEIRALSAQVGEMRQAARPDLAKLADAERALMWQTRIFADRRATMTYVCEAPRLVEQRLFALGRTIAKALRN